jgi:hypothetical protein
MPTHFDSLSGEPVAIETHVHLLSEHVSAGLTAGWTLFEMKERVIDDAWLALKPSGSPFETGRSRSPSPGESRTPPTRPPVCSASQHFRPRLAVAQSARRMGTYRK